MRYHALATDYDGTLAHHGAVADSSIAALERLRASGRKLILVTGRELPDLQRVFSRLDLFDRVVAENGALLYRPATKEEHVLAEAPPERFVAALRQRNVSPLSVGRSIVATWEPHQLTVLEVIRELGLELHVIFNKGAVMVLPSGINKQTGLRVALRELSLSPHNVVGIGDAENDHAFLNFCECAVAVANALPTLQERADYTTAAHHGPGVEELIAALLDNDLKDLELRLTRHRLLLGENVETGEEIFISPYGGSVLVAGPSGSGKSTAATGLLERLAERDYQFCLIDPEGDYENIPAALTLGSSRTAPSIDEVMQAVADPEENVVVNLLGLPLADRPLFFATLLPRIAELRVRTGRPHWLVIDEAHHLLPSSWVPASGALTRELQGMLLVTVHPDHVAPAALQPVDVVVAVGKSPSQTVSTFAHALKLKPPRQAEISLATGEALVWMPDAKLGPIRTKIKPGQADRRRHLRKYAQGELGPDKSFFFRGPQGKLNLRAHNLQLFAQIAEGVDDDTWMYHLRRGDYSQWFRREIKDPELAAAAEGVERESNTSPAESRARIKAAIEERYTAPA